MAILPISYIMDMETYLSHLFDAVTLAIGGPVIKIGKLGMKTVIVNLNEIKAAFKAGRATGGASKLINPNEIRFSQTSVNGAKEITESMKVNGWVGDPIDVVKMSDGRLTTVDNARYLLRRMQELT